MDALENAGRQSAAFYLECTLYTTLPPAPCVAVRSCSTAFHTLSSARTSPSWARSSGFQAAGFRSRSSRTSAASSLCASLSRATPPLGRGHRRVTDLLWLNVSPDLFSLQPLILREQRMRRPSGRRYSE